MPSGDGSTHLVVEYFDAQRPEARTHVAAEVEERRGSGEAGEDYHDNEKHESERRDRP